MRCAASPCWLQKVQVGAQGKLPLLFEPPLPALGGCAKALEMGWSSGVKAMLSVFRDLCCLTALTCLTIMNRCIYKWDRARLFELRSDRARGNSHKWQQPNCNRMSGESPNPCEQGPEGMWILHPSDFQDGTAQGPEQAGLVLRLAFAVHEA